MFRIGLMSMFLCFIIGCTGPVPITVMPPSIDDRFDSNMAKVIKKYSDNYGRRLDPQYHGNFLAPKNGYHSYSQIFELNRRLFLPNLKNLTFDYRSYTPCGGCWNYQMIHVYNDSMSFILPMTDDEIYWRMSSKQIDSSFLTSPNFNTELNAMVNYFNFDDIAMKIALFDEIMRNQRFWKMDLSDIPKLAMISNSLIKNNLYNKACKDKLLDNLKRAESYVKQGNFVYTDGVNIVRDTSLNKEFQLEILNTECNFQMLY